MLRRSSERENELLLPSSPAKHPVAGNNIRRSSIPSTSRILEHDTVDEGFQASTKTNNNHKRHHQRLTSIMSPSIIKMWSRVSGYMNSTRLMVLLVLCLQNSLFTVLRRYSQGVLQENYSKHELLLVAELIKIAYSSWMISVNLSKRSSTGEDGGEDGSSSSSSKSLSLPRQLMYLVSTSRKMFVLALVYGAMNILSFVSLRNISAGMFTIFAQCKILTTATFSTLILKRQYSWTKWRSLIALMLGVLLFCEPIWSTIGTTADAAKSNGNPLMGTIAVLIEVTLSGFASIYFEKVIKTDPLQLGIWERNFQLALGSVPVYIAFIIGDLGTAEGLFSGWSPLAVLLSFLGAGGGLLVALSIKYGDSILKTLATTGAIVLTGILDHVFLGGPLTPAMILAGLQVIIAICNYTFDATPATTDASNTLNELESGGGTTGKGDYSHGTNITHDGSPRKGHANP